MRTRTSVASPPPTTTSGSTERLGEAISPQLEPARRGVGLLRVLARWLQPQRSRHRGHPRALARSRCSRSSGSAGCRSPRPARSRAPTTRSPTSGARCPIHLVGAGVELERRTKGVAGAARMSPHALRPGLPEPHRELCGASSRTAGSSACSATTCRLTRQAYLAFDLEAMFSGEVYADFALLWLTCHQSRFEPQDEQDRGLLAGALDPGRADPGHPGAQHASRRGRDRDLDAGSWVRRPSGQRRAPRGPALGRARHRRLLPGAAAPDLPVDLPVRGRGPRAAPPRGHAPRKRAPATADFYSMTRMRHLAERLRGGPHPDLWRSFVFVCAQARRRRGLPRARPAVPRELAVLPGCVPASGCGRAREPRSAGRGPRARVHRAGTGAAPDRLPQHGLGGARLDLRVAARAPSGDPPRVGHVHAGHRRRQRAQDHRQLLHAHLADLRAARHRARPGARRGRVASPRPRPRSWT